MEASLEVEDDVFFADLSKRIALLIMDDDNDTDTSRSHGCCSSVSLQAFSYAYSPVTTPVVYEADGARVSKGTGVFIPRSSFPRKKSRSGRFSSSNQAKYQKQHSDKSRISNL